MRILAVFITFLFCINISQAQDCPVVLFGNQSGVQGDTVVVDVYLSNLSSFLGFQGTINYDPSIMSFVTHEKGELLTDQFNLGTNEPFFGSGQILIVGTNAFPEVGYFMSNVLFSLIFVLDGEQSGTSEITFDSSVLDLFFINTNVESVFPCDIINGSVSNTNTPPPSDFEVSVFTSNAICNQAALGSITASGFFGVPPYTYFWTGPNSFTSNAQNIIELLPGLYNLTATDAVGTTVEINDIEIQLEGGDFGFDPAYVQNNYCDTGMEGFIRTDVSFNNTGADLFYEWSNGLTDEDITELSNGVYTLTVTDDTGCSQVHEYEITSSRAFRVDFEVSLPCEGESSGTIYPYVISGDLDFFWSTGAVTDSIENLSAGTYEVTIQEPQGCLQVRTIELEEIIENSSVVENTLCSFLGLNNGFFLPTFSGDLEGTSIGLELIDAAGNSASPTELGPGDYSYIISSINGCNYEGAFTMEGSLSDYTEDYYSCLLDSIQMVTSSNNPNLLYSWSPDSSFVIDSVANPIFLDAQFASPNFRATLLTSGEHGCTRSFDFNIIQQDACVWPGDTNEDNIVNAEDLLHIGIANGNLGAARPMPNVTDWATQPSVLWNENIGLTTLDKMFADCNGDGIVNDEDILVVAQNIGLSHLSFTSELEEDRAMGPPLFVDLLPSYLDGVEHDINIVLGDATDQAINAHGVAFQIKYDPNITLITEGSFQEQGWLSSDENITWDIQFADDEAGILEVAVTRTNGVGLDGQGPIATFKSSFTATQKTEIEFEIMNVVLLTSDAISMPVQNMSSVSVIGTSSTSSLSSDLYNESISPNPSSDYIVVRSDRNIDAYYISNAMGQSCKHGALIQNQIDIHTLIPGLYTIQLEGVDGVTAHKLIVK